MVIGANTNITNAANQSFLFTEYYTKEYTALILKKCVQQKSTKIKI